MMGNYHVRCGVGEKPEMETSEAYLSLLAPASIAITLFQNPCAFACEPIRELFDHIFLLLCSAV